MGRTRIEAALALGLVAGGVAADELTGNIGVTNNYVWRGLTQTQNEAAVQGGIDYAADNGFYIGTWISNVSYAPDDPYSYEHDVYFGVSGGDRISWDVGYLYYNYDEAANFDFGELYGSIGIGGFSLSANVLINTEADEPLGRDYGAGEALYVAGSYTFELREGLELGLHLGYHEGDFAEDFNGVPDAYLDYSISLAKDGFSVMVSGTDLDDPGDPDPLDNDELKFTVAYGMDFDL